MSATVYVSSHGNLCYDSRLHGSVVPVKFLLVSVNTLLAGHETSNALVRMLSEERTTPCSVERDSAHTERVLTRLVVDSPAPRQPSISQVKKRVFALHPWIGRLILCCLLSRCTHDSHGPRLGFHFVRGSGANAWIHGNISSRPLMSSVALMEQHSPSFLVTESSLNVLVAESRRVSEDEVWNRWSPCVGGFSARHCGCRERAARERACVASESEVEQHELTLTILEVVVGTAFVPTARKAHTMKQVWSSPLTTC